MKSLEPLSRGSLPPPHLLMPTTKYACHLSCQLPETSFGPNLRATDSFYLTGTFFPFLSYKHLPMPLSIPLKHDILWLYDIHIY